jgi:ribosomal-protein-alanine N-acetyltransferase
MSFLQAIPVSVEVLSNNDDDLNAVQAIDEASFPPTTRMDIREELTRPYSRCWIARESSTTAYSAPIGIIVTWFVADELHVLNVATMPAFRRRGVGRALMDAALAFARENQVRLLILEVRRNNRPAIRLYKGLGFFISNLREGYYTDNGEDALEMMLELNLKTGEIVTHPDDIPGLDL